MIPSCRMITLGLVTLTLLGCATNQLHDDGMALIDEGHTMEGLAKLEAAVKQNPTNLGFRADLIRHREQLVYRLLTAADSERSIGHLDAAAQRYRRALLVDPGNPRAHSGLAAVAMDRRHLATLAQAKTLFHQHDLAGAQRLLRAILVENPYQSDAIMLQRKIDEQMAKDAMAGPTLDPKYKKPVTLQFRDANLKMVIEALSRSSGINILLDKDVRPDLKTTIFVNDATVEDTIDLILLQNNLAKKVLSDNTILIYPSNPAKIKEYQDLVIRTFQLTNADAKQMQTMIKTVLKTKDLYVDEKTNSLVMRDTPDAVRLAEKLIAAQDLPQPEVMLEVEVLEVTRAKLTELGVKLPEEIALSASGSPATTTVNNLPGGGVVTTTTPEQPLTLSTLKNINGSYFNVSPLNASIDLRHEDGDVNILANPRIRVRNREKAKILIGDRVPVITNAITPVATGTPVVTGNVQYLDVGLKLEVEPEIHLDNDVAIKINLQVNNIVREVSSGPTLAYQIGTREASTILRLKDGETQVLAGLINNEDRKTAQKFPGLGELPILGRLFSSHKNDNKKTEIVLSITPHLTRTSERPDAKDVEFWSGTAGDLRSRRITYQHSQTIAANVSAATAIVPVTDTPETQAPASRPAPATVGTDATAPVVLSWRGPGSAKVGQEFQVSVDATAHQSLSTLSFTLGFDPKVLSIVRVAEGDLLKRGGRRTIFTKTVDRQAGQAFIHSQRLGPRGAEGQGSIATITFVARAAADQSAIAITEPKMVSSNGQPLPPAPLAPLAVTVER